MLENKEIFANKVPASQKRSWHFSVTLNHIYLVAFKLPNITAHLKV